MPDMCAFDDETSSRDPRGLAGPQLDRLIRTPPTPRCG